MEGEIREAPARGGEAAEESAGDTPEASSVVRPLIADEVPIPESELAEAPAAAAQDDLGQLAEDIPAVASPPQDVENLAPEAPVVAVPPPRDTEELTEAIVAEAAPPAADGSADRLAATAAVREAEGIAEDSHGRGAGDAPAEGGQQTGAPESEVDGTEVVVAGVGRGAAEAAVARLPPRPVPHPDALICAVCLDEILEGERRSRAGKHTGCKHVFHWECIKQWFRVKAVCPVCNTLLFDHGIFEVDPITGRERYHRIRPEGAHGSLASAAAEGNVQEIQRLIQSGASVNRTTVGDVAPLHIAAHHGHAEAVARLLAGGAAVNQASQGGATPLYLAAQNRHADAVARLIAGGAEVNQATDDGGAPLHVASQGGHVQAVAWLLASSAQVDQATGSGTTPLFLASQGGHTDVVVRLLAQGASANRSAADGSTPLHFAALHGHTDCVARLLVGGAIVNQASHVGGAALHVAAQGGHTEAVAWLLAGKAEVNQEMVGGATPLFLAARGGHSEVIAWLLAKQAAVDASTRLGATPLFIAARGGHAEAVGRLLAGGPAVNQKACNGATALRCAVLFRHTEVIGRLLSHGAKPQASDMWLCLVLGNLRGARKLAMADGYSFALWRTGLKLCLGIILAIALLMVLGFGILNEFRHMPQNMAPLARNVTVVSNATQGNVTAAANETVAGVEGFNATGVALSFTEAASVVGAWAAGGFAALPARTVRPVAARPPVSPPPAGPLEPEGSALGGDSPPSLGPLEQE